MVSQIMIEQIQATNRGMRNQPEGGGYHRQGFIKGLKHLVEQHRNNSINDERHQVQR